MNCVGKITAWLLAILWMPLVCHCCLEQLPGLQFLACAASADAGHTSRDCGDYACDTVESGLYQTEEQSPILPLPAPLPVLGLVPDLAALCVPDHPGADFVFNPPELLRIWQFYLRAAPLPRAPSRVA